MGAAIPLVKSGVRLSVSARVLDGIAASAGEEKLSSTKLVQAETPRCASARRDSKRGRLHQNAQTDTAAPGTDGTLEHKCSAR
eukprot:6466643-Amphidinium_carterae.1